MYELAIKRRISTLVGVAALVVLGVFALLQLPVALLPELTRPLLVVEARAEQRSREEMLASVVAPIERRLASIPGLTSMWSEAEDRLARVVLEPAWQTDPDRLRIDAARYIEGASEIPLDSLSITVTGGDASAIVEVGVLGGESAAARTEFARKILVPDLARIPGAGRVEAIGYAPLRAVVRPLNAALAARGLSAADLAARLRDAGVSASAGSVRDGATVRPLVARDRISSLAGLRALRISGSGGEILLDDVATVDLEEVPEGGAFRLNGEDGILVRLYRAPRANAVALAAAARGRVAEVASRARSGIRVEVVSERSSEVRASLEGLAWAAAMGVLLGTLVLRLALGRWMPTLSLAVVLPASSLITFGAFRIWGIPLDVVSLAGLALAAGMLVDNSIVVLEAIESSRAEGAPDPRLSGTRSVATAVTASCATTIVVFLPLLYIGGLARAFFGEQAFAVAASIAVSLLLSLTLTPVLAGKSGISRGHDLGRRGFEALLARAMRAPALVLALAASLAAAALGVAVILPRELLPRGTSSSIRVDFQLSADLSFDEARRRAGEIEALASGSLREAGIDDASIRGVLETGESVFAPGGAGSAGGRIEIDFGDPSEARRALPGVKLSVEAVPGVRARAAERPSAFEEAIVAGKERLEILVSAPDEDLLARLVERVSTAVEQGAGTAPAIAEEARPRAAVDLEWDESRLAALGIERSSADEQVRAALGGISLGRIEIEGADPEILIEPADRLDLGALPVRIGPSSGEGAAGEDAEAGGRAVVPLAALARTDLSARPARVRRLEGRPAAQLRVEAPSRGGLAAADLARILRGVSLGPGESVKLGGEASEMAASFGDLRLALGLSIVLVFLVIAALYESLLLPVIIMSILPLAGGGALAMLALAGQSLNVMSFLGIIVLGGIAVNNAIVLVDRMEKMRAEGEPPERSACRAAAERYRPILMTSATTILGMLPLAAVGGAGVELRRALAVAVLGGMTASTLAALFVLPVLYKAVARWRPAPGRALP